MSMTARPPRFSRSLVNLSSELQGLIRTRLWLQVLIGMVLGIGTGLLLGEQAGLVSPEMSARIGAWLALPGQLFLAIIKFVVVPLIAASVIRGIAAGGDGATLQKLGSRVVAFFLVSTIVAAFLGLAVATLIEPGRYLDGAMLQRAVADNPPVPHARPDIEGEAVAEQGPDVTGALVSLIPTNPFETLIGGDMLQIVIAAAILGIALVNLPATQARPMLDLLGSVQAACMVIVRWAMHFAPLAVFGLLAQVIADVGLDALVGTGAYVLTVLAGLAILMALYLLLVGVAARRSPGAFLAAVREVVLLGFSTSSSAAVMPVSLRTAEENLNVRPAVARFVVPLGATINMGGTALYQAAAAIFLAQVFGIDIGLAGIMLIVTTAVGASIGAPGTPGVGIVVLATILAGIGVPEAGIVLILGVDRILDMARTAVNVTGDLVACVVMDRWVGAEIDAAAPAASPEPV